MRNRKEKIKRYRLESLVNKSFFDGLNLIISPSGKLSSTSVKLLDTFDWRLFKNGLTLKQLNSSFELYSLKSSGVTASDRFRASKRPVFLKDFPEGQLRKELSRHISIRALVPAAEYKEQNTDYSVLNNDDKTVARLEYKIITFGNRKKENFYYLTLRSVRGYDDEFNTLDSHLRDEGLNTTAEDPYLGILMSSGRKPGEYSSKFRLEIDPALSSAEALRQILLHLISTMKANEKGISEDIDIEFLHDFRVAVRRARSALSQIKYVFPEVITLKLKNDFSKIGKMTNRLRDLDVYLLMKGEYINMLPNKLKKGIDPVFSRLEKERVREQRKIKTALSGKVYRSSLEDALKCLETDYTDSESARNSSRLILPLAKKFIWKKYRKIISSGLLIDDSTPDEKLHELRIECKKLRYLLEFFTTLFPSEKMAVLIPQLKKLQDNLGDFNDYFVQQESLGDMLKGLNQKDPEYSDITMSVGGLIAILSSKQNEARKEFNKRFSEFARKENQELYGKLFT